MSKFLMVLVVGALASAASAQANSLYCVSKYFNGMDVKVVVKADVVSETELKDFSLSFDSELASTAEKLEMDPTYRPSPTYQGFIRMDGEFTEHDAAGEFSSYGFLIPEDFTSSAKFEAYVTEKGSDGGSYNKVFCFNNP